MSLRTAVLACLTSLLAATPSALRAASSALDSAFVAEISPGLTPTGYPTFDDGTGAVNATALQSDGKILAGGNVSRYKTSGDLTALKRLLPSGALDTSFNAGGAGLAASSGQPEINAILRVAGDKLYLGGVFSSYNGVARSGFLRLNADGSLDTAFDAVGLAGDTRYVMALAEQADGKLLVGGGFSNINGTFRRNLARLNPDGTLDNAFAPSGFNNNNSVRDIALDSAGRIYVAGLEFVGARDRNEPILRRYFPDGTLDVSFSPVFGNDFGSISSLLVLADGRVLAGGSLTLPDGTLRHLACFKSDGSADTAFNTALAGVIDGEVMDLVASPEGGILASGIFTLFNDLPRASIARISPAGVVDTELAPAPYLGRNSGYITHLYSLAVQPDGRIVAGGWFDRISNPALETVNLTRFEGDFAAGPGKLGFTSATFVANENAGTALVSVARHGGVNGAVSVNYAASAGTATSADFTATSGTLSWAAGEGGVKTFSITLANDSAAELQETIALALSAPTGSAVLMRASATLSLVDDDSAPVITLAPVSASLEQGASFTLRVGYSSAIPATVKWQRDPDGAGPLPFADIPGATGTSYSVLAATPELHAGTYRAVLTSTAGSTNSDPAAVAISVPAGSVNLTAFNSNLAGAVTKAASLGDGRYVALTASGLVRLNANGTQDNTFGPVAFMNGASAGSPADLLLQPDGKIIVGGFFNALSAAGFSTARTGVARFHANGTVDTDFNLNLASNHFVQTLALGADGKLYVGGTSGAGLKRFAPAAAPSTNLALDTTFGTNGAAANIGTGIPNGYVWGVQELADGHVLVAHQTGNISSTTYAFNRLTPAGVIDPAFVVPATSWNIYSWDILPDGRIAVAGRFSTIDGKPLKGLAILHADGSLGSSFIPDTGSSSIVGVRHHQGRLLAWGNFTTPGGPSHLARFNLDGSLDASFSVGVGANGPVTSLFVTAAGDFDVFGSFTEIKGVARAYAARLVGNAHIGAIGFVPGRVSAIESGLPLTLTLRRYGPAVEPVSIDYATADATTAPSATAGSDYAAATGTVSWATGDTADKTIAIQRLNDTAQEPAETFRVLLSNPSGPVNAAASATVTLLDDDTPATFTTQPTGPASALFAGGSLNLAAAVVSSPTPVGYQWFLNGVAIPGATSASFTKNPVSLADAGLYTLVATNAAGSFPSAFVHVVIQPQPGRIAPGLATTGRPTFASGGGVQSVVALPDGGALIGGFFGQNLPFNIPQGYLVRVKSDGSVDTSFTLNLGNNVRELLAQPDGKILIAGDFTFVNGVNQRYLYRLDADLTPDTAFNAAVATAINTSWGQPSSIALDSAGRVYLGFNNFSSGGSVWRFSSAGALDADYTLSTTGGGVTALAIQADDRLLVGGNFTGINRFGQTTVSKNRLARVATDGAIDAGFTAALGSLSPSDLLVTPAGRIFLLGSSSLYEISATDGSTLSTTSTTYQAYEIASGPDGRLALARSAASGNGSISRRNIPVGAATTADTTFNVGGGPNNDVTSLAYAADGSLWIAGAFSTFDNVATGGVVKLQGSAGDPGIVNPPARADVNPGANAAFAVGATGTGLTYQWLRNGVPLTNDSRISGATTAVLVITGVVASDDDIYAVAVTGGTPSATVTSAPAKLNVLGAPVVAASPASVTPALGSTITLAADVLAATPASYVWKRDGVTIVNGGRYSGATTGTLVVTGANSSDNGAYTLTVTNNLGSVSTTPATVTVAQTSTARDATTTALNGASSLVNDILHLPDGRVLLGVNGTFNGANSTNTSAQLVVVAPDASVSSSAAGSFNGQVQKLLRQPDGKILVAGSFGQVGAVARARLARLNADLTLDTGFVPPSHTASGTFNRLALDAQGRVYLGGSFATYAGQIGYHYLVRLDPATGALDPTFRASDFGVTSDVNALVADGAGRLYVGGSFSRFDSTTATTLYQPLVRLTAAGALDTAYVPALPHLTDVFSHNIRVLALDSSDRLLVASEIFPSTGSFIYPLVRLDSSGALDASFTLGATLGQYPSVILPLPSGKILLGGLFSTPAPGRLLRLNADGSADTAHAAALGAGLNSGGVAVIAPDPAGRLWIGGSGFSQYQGVAANRLVVLQGEGPAFAFTQQPGGQVRDLGSSATFTVAATGNNGLSYQWRKNGVPLADGGRISGATTPALTIAGLVASDAAGYSVVVSLPSGPAAFATHVSATASLTVLAAPEILGDPASLTADVGGSATFTGSARGAATLAYQWLHGTTPLADGTVGGVTIAGATTPTLTLSGLTFAQAGEYKLRVTNTHGSATTAPAVLTVEKRPGALAAGNIGKTTANNAVLAILRLQDGSMLVGGQFTTITVNGAAHSRSRLARFLADGSLDASFAPIFSSTVTSLAQDSAGRIFVGGDFTLVNGVSRIRVARLTSALALDTAFDTSSAGPNGIINAVAPTGDGGVYVGGAFGFNRVGTATVNRIARLEANGALDTGFTAAAGINNEVKALLRRSDGKLYAAGTFGTALLTGAGAVDSSFNAGFLVQGQALLQLSDGSLVIGANASLLRVNQNTGATISTYSTNHSIYVSALATQADGKLLSGSYGVLKRTNIATGTDDSGFLAFDAYIRAIALDASGRIWVGGSFGNYNGASQGRLAVLSGGDYEARDGLLLPHTLTFADIADTTYATPLASRTITLSATSDRNLSPITFSVKSSTPAGIATITGDKLVFTGAGSITVQAAQAGNATYRAATAEQTFNVAKAAQTISFAKPSDRVVGAPAFELSATATSGLPVAFAVSSEPAGVATLGGDGKTVTLSATVTGAVTATATQPGDANHHAATAITHTFQVTNGTPQTIEFAKPADRLVTAAPFALVATAKPSGLPVSFQVVSGPATLGSDGKTLALTGAGTVTIRATQAGGLKNGVTYAAASAEQSFQVDPVPPKPQSITFNKPAARVFGSAPAVVVATSSSKLPVTITVIEGPGEIDSDGKLVLTGAGSVKLRATQPGNAIFDAAEAREQTLIVNKAPQTITFSAPAKLPLGTEPVVLAALATPSGLPVAISLVSGPATLDGATLRFTGTGTVKLRATQPGDDNYLAAKPVEKTITVTSTAVLTIDKPSLSATYDGLDHAVVVTGVPEGFADKLVVTYNGSPALPRDAGTYNVVASLGALKKTAQLVIKKADLAVSFDDRVRLVGEANPTVFEPRYTGFQDNDTAADLAATRPRGVTAAKISSNQGDYPITFTGGVDKNYRYVAGEPAVLTVIGYGGTYEALLVDDASTPVGKLTLTPSKNSLGYTGTLNLARETASVVVASTSKSAGTTTLVATEDFSSATATWTRNAAGKDTLALTFTVTRDGALTGSLDRNGEPFATLSGGRILYAPPAKTVIPWAGQHTLALHSAFVKFTENEGTFPRGSGVATAVVSTTNGNLVLNGKLADGTTLTATLKPWITRAENGALDQVGYVAWITPYGTRAESFLAGALDLQPHPEAPSRFPAGRRYIPSDAGLLTWKKAGANADKSYRSGFGPLSVSVSLDPWLPPVVAKPAKGAIPAVDAITLPQRLGLVTDPAATTATAGLTISHGPDELDLGEREGELPFAATLAATATPTATTALTGIEPSANLAKWKLTAFNAATGAFSGTFVLSDQVPAPTKANPSATKPHPRTVTFTGTLRQAPADEDGVLVGTGFFLVPGLPVPSGTPTPEQPSGEIRFSRP